MTIEEAVRENHTLYETNMDELKAICLSPAEQTIPGLLTSVSCYFWNFTYDFFLHDQMIAFVTDPIAVPHAIVVSCITFCT